MAFENWNRFLQECLKQKESEHKPPPQKIMTATQKRK